MHFSPQRLLAILVSCALSSAPIFAATYTPTKFTDSADGSCDADCSLREAIIASNANPGVDIIQLGVGTYQLTLEGRTASSGDLDITDTVILEGVDFEQTVIEQTVFEQRVIEIDISLAEIVLRDLAITGGDVSGIPEDGGGIKTRSDLRLERVRVNDNHASEGAGGGIDASSVALTILESEFYDNSSGSSAAIGLVFGEAQVSDSVFRNNSSLNGGAVQLSLTDSLVEGSTFEGNATALGLSVTSKQSAQVRNSTFSSNSSGIFASGDGPVAIEHVTVEGQSVNLETSLFLENPNVTLRNSALDVECQGSQMATSLGGNVDANSNCFVAIASDQVNVGEGNLGLGPLRDNGGLTDTHAILNFTSPLVAVEQSGCDPQRDQPGAHRDFCDAGAYSLPVCFEPGSPIQIPDDDPVGVTFEITDSLSVGGDLDVFVDIEHTGVGDLIVTLEGAGPVSVDLVNRPLSNNCDGNDIRTFFDDEAQLVGDTDCREVTTLEAYPRARYQPTQSLAVFDQLEGAISMTVSDNAAADTGRVHRVCLYPSLTKIFEDGFESGDTSSWFATTP